MAGLEFLKEYFYLYETEIFYISGVVFILGLAQSFIYLVQILLALSEISRIQRRQKDNSHWHLLTSNITLPISIIIPTYNEETTIEDTLTSILGIQYPSFEVVVVNDGSIDRTLEVLIERYQLQKSIRFFEPSVPHKEIRGIYTSTLFPKLVVVDKENGKRADALNAGIDVSRYPLFCTVDADSLLDATSLIKAVEPFLQKPQEMMASGGTVRILNGCVSEDGVVKKVQLTRKLLPLFQVVEYIRSFLMGRMSWSRIGVLTIISGAFSVFRREMAVEVEGFDINTLGEDFELVLKIHKHCREHKIPYDVRFVPEPVCWTEVPETWKGLASQRIRWQQGALEVFFKYKGMLFNPKYGRIGCVAMPFTLLFDVIGPIAELIGYVFVPLFYLIGVLNTEIFLAVIGLLFVFGISVSTMSLVLEEVSVRRFSKPSDLLVLAFIAVIENFGYRQMNNIWRMRGWWRFLRRDKRWGAQARGSRL